MGKMTQRQNTLVCAFDVQRPRISAFDIHEWIHDAKGLQETEEAMVQVDGHRRHVYITFRYYHKMQETLSTNRRGGIPACERSYLEGSHRSGGFGSKAHKISKPPSRNSRPSSTDGSEQIRGGRRGAGGNLVLCLPLPSCQRHSNCSGRPISIYSNARHNSGISNLNILRGATHYLLWL